MAAYPQFGQPTTLPPSQLLGVSKPGGSNASSPEPGSRPSLPGAPPSLPTAPTAPQSPYAVPYNPALLAYPRLPGLSESMYGASLAGTQGIYSLGTDPAAFYVNPITGTPYDLKDNAEIWRNLAQPTACLPYDPATLAAYPYAGYGGIDLSLAARRKNATKENTSTLKAWLNEHKKNPYPTKGEKIMLAIITKMTLTQVSTWFANARRRLKKENKMTWSPKSKEDGSDDEGDNEDNAESRANETTNGDNSLLGENSRDNDHTQVDVLGDSDDEAEDNNLPRPSSAERLSMEQMKTSHDTTDTDSGRGRESPVRKETDCSSEPNRPSSPTQRPRIWSLDDVLGPTRSSSPPGSEHTPSAPAHTTSTLPFPFPLKPTVTSLPVGLSHTAASLRHWAERSPYTLPASLTSLAHPYGLSAAVFSTAGRTPGSPAFPGLPAAAAVPPGLHPAVSMAAGLGGPVSSLHVSQATPFPLRPGDNYHSQSPLRNGLVSAPTPIKESDRPGHSPPPTLTAFRPVNRSKPADVVKV